MQIGQQTSDAGFLIVEMLAIDVVLDTALKDAQVSSTVQGSKCYTHQLKLGGYEGY